ncbi:MAG: hypothetical protein K6F76_03635 [Clostridiales bacterium]|nr:hypothetical protein [Clostridiales bacterium]
MFKKAIYSTVSVIKNERAAANGSLVFCKKLANPQMRKIVIFTDKNKKRNTQMSFSDTKYYDIEKLR